MLLILGTLIQYGLLLGGSVFLVWFSTIEIRYQNKQCSLINITNFVYNAVNGSMIDPRLKLNHFTILGTHNSYHRANLISKYEHRQLDEQFSWGIRQIELDVHIMKNNLLVYHLQIFDDRTNCYCFKECLIKIVRWTEKNRSHFPIYLFIEIKQMFYEDLITGLTGGVKCEHFEQIRDEILDVFSLNTFILPNQIQGNQTSISSALQQQRDDELSSDYTYYNYGWPPVAQSLGKIIPVFLDDVHRRAETFYAICDPLQNFFLIAQPKVNLTYSSIITVANQIKSIDKLKTISNNGQIMRLLLGYGNDNLDQTYQLAKPYGVHIVSSDSVYCNDTTLCQSLRNDFRYSNILCNSVSAPSFCNSSLSFLY